MSSNAELAEIFRTIADLLDVLGEKFKPEAYRRAARSIESLTEDIGAVAARGELQSIPGVGQAIAEKIEAYLRTGSIPYYEKLKHEVPPGLIDLMRLPGLGPKTARRFWVELGIEGPNELRDAIAAGRLDGMKGFGERKIEQIRSAVSGGPGATGSARRPIDEVYPLAHSLVRALREGAPTDRVEVAGSFRRARDTVGDLDLLVTTEQPQKVFETFSALPLVDEVVMRGDTKETVILHGDLQVDLRVVKPEEFGAAFLYFTGSKDHNVHLRSLARDRGLKVNEYGVFRGEKRIAGATEEEVYSSLDLAWIPPELREDRGEIELAARGMIPRLVTENDLKGDLHVHLPFDARPDAVDRLVQEAHARGYAYVGVVVGAVRGDGTVGLLPESTRSRLAEQGPAGLRIALALEAGRGALPKALEAIPHEYRILRPTPSSRESAGAGEARHAPSATVVAHVGASTAKDASALGRWVEEARRLSAAIEVGPGPERLDSGTARQARDAGVALHVPTGLLATTPDDPTRPVALGFSRRAGAAPDGVLNTGTLRAVSTAWSELTLDRRERPSGPPKSRSGRKRAAA